MKKLLALGCLAFPLGLGTAAPAPALAAAGSSIVCDRYADSSSGTDREGGLHGSEVMPYRSGQFLVDHLRRGEVGCLRGSPVAGKGLYKERLRVRGGLALRRSPARSLVKSPGASTLVPAPASSPTTLRSEPGQVATIDGLSIPAMASEVTVSNLVIDGTTETPSSTPVVDIAASNTVFSDNNVTSGASRPCVRIGTLAARLTQVTLRRNRIHNCTTGVEVSAADLTSLEYNLIYDNIDRGVRIGTDGDLSFVWRNILDHNGEGLSFANEALFAPGSNMVRDNVITNSTTRWNAAAAWVADTAKGYANYFWRNCVSASNVDAGFNTNGGVQFPTDGYGVFYPIVRGDPGYSDPDNKEFQIDTDSECRRLIGVDPYTVAISGGVPDDSAITQPRPNILFIVTDDQRADTVGDLDPTADENGDGNPANDYWMPNTLKWFRDGSLDGGLVAGGSEFDDGFTTTPKCCPARASIFAGRFAHNTGVQDNDQGRRLNHNLTLQRYLSDPAQGGTTYRTGIFGKFLNDWNLRLNPPHWDDWSIFAGGYTPTQVNERGTLKVVTQYSTDYFSDRAKQFIDEAESEEDRPWFLYVAPFAPHDHPPLTGMPEAPPAGDDDYRENCAIPPCLEVPPGGDSDPARKEGRAGENPLTDKPLWVRNWRDSTTVFPNAGHSGLREPSLRTLKSVDDMVDDLFKKLEERGEERNTLAIYVSDNGFLWREHGDWHKERQLGAGQGCPDINPDPFRTTQCPGTGLSGKDKPQTDSIKVPYYVRWRANPAIRRGFVDKQRLVANIDLAPTAMDAANLEPDSGEPMDGRSLLDASQDRSEILTEGRIAGDSCADTASFSLPQWASLRTNAYHFIEYYEKPTGVTPCALSGETNREYYDLTNDPEELNNLLGDGDPGNDPPDLAALSQRLYEARRCAGATCSPGSNPNPSDPQPDVQLLTPPDGALLSETVTLEAEAFDNFGVHTVQFLIDGQPLGAPITSPQWLARWDTTGLSGSHTVSAVARDDPQDSGTVSSALVEVNNSSPSGTDIQITDPEGMGGSSGRGHPESGDKITYSFSTAMDPQSFIANWDGSGSRTVTVNINSDVAAYGYQDTVTVSGVDNNALGVIDLGRNDYLRGYFSIISSFTGSMTMSPDGKQIEIVLGTQVGGTAPATASGGGGMTWLAPQGTARDTSGAFLCGCHVREAPTVNPVGILYDDFDF